MVLLRALLVIAIVTTCASCAHADIELAASDPELYGGFYASPNLDFVNVADDVGCLCTLIFDPYCFNGTLYSSPCEARCFGIDESDLEPTLPGGACNRTGIVEGWPEVCSEEKSSESSLLLSPCETCTAAGCAWSALEGIAEGGSCSFDCDRSSSGCWQDVGSCPSAPMRDPDCVCFEVYLPVCGRDGVTYSNSCEAGCWGLSEMDYTDGECPLPEIVVEEPAVPCPFIYAPVCGIDQMTYPNGCTAEASGIFEYTIGECQTNCTLTGGETVSPGWSGPDSGDDFCNQCMCGENGLLGCTKKKCAPICSVPPDFGIGEVTCFSIIEQYFWNSTAEECQLYGFPGCGPVSPNRFDTVDECRSECDVSYIPEGKNCTLSDGVTEVENGWAGNDAGDNYCNTCSCSDGALACTLLLCPPLSACDLPIVTGPCRAAIPKWGYNVRSGACEMFMYGGCTGNDNNFDTQDECIAECVEDVFS